MPPTDDDRIDLSPPDELLDRQSPPWSGDPWPLPPGQPLGQTFVARHDGLCAVEVLLAVTPDVAGEVTLTLHRDGPDGEQLGQRSLPVAALAPDRYARFPISPLTSSAGSRFYFSLSASAGSPDDARPQVPPELGGLRGAGIAVYATGAARLGDGTAWRNHTPVDGCLAFRAFAAGDDARLAARREIERLQALNADLGRRLVAAEQALDAARAREAALAARLQALLGRLAPAAVGQRSGSTTDA